MHFLLPLKLYAALYSFKQVTSLLKLWTNQLSPLLWSHQGACLQQSNVCNTWALLFMLTFMYVMNLCGLALECVYTWKPYLRHSWEAWRSVCNTCVLLFVVVTCRKVVVCGFKNVFELVINKCCMWHKYWWLFKICYTCILLFKFPFS